MADHVTVDLPTLRRAQTSLTEVADALRTPQAGRDHDVAVLGHPALAGAMSDFASGWRVHRKHLLDSVEAHRGMVQAAIDGYTGLDRGLAESVTPK